MEKVKCRICGVTLFKITTTHLKRVHNMTMKEYLEKFPDERVAGEGVGESKEEKLSFKLEELKSKDKTPEVLEITIPEIKSTIENLDIEKDVEEVTKVVTIKEQEQDKEKVRLNMSESKRKVYDLLRTLFGYVETNYFIEKIDILGHLVYKIITDFYIPPRKLIIDFPDMFWHNFDIVSEKVKNNIRNDGYTLVRIYGKEHTDITIIEKLSKEGVIPQDLETL